MCGIAGVLGRAAADKALLERMATRVRHRGPDDAGIWCDAEAGIGLAHRRLSIVDLSPSGHQPMASADGRWLICYNGEIYNHHSLRQALEQEGAAPPNGWRGHSDTETLVEAIATWGLTRTLERSVGMFALALWDRADRTLSLARDRFGEKPLHYGWAGRDFVFGSELKSLREHPDFSTEIDREALASYAALTYVPAPRTIYRRIFKLEPATILTVVPGVEARDAAPTVGTTERSLSLHSYWDYRSIVEEGHERPISNEQDAIQAVEAALDAAVLDQSIADVPVGAFLSGGIDSSSVVASYQAQSARPIRTYTIGFDDDALNEAPHARAIARHLGTDHHELIVTDRDARDVIPALPGIYDEPFADSSQIPTFVVSRFARHDVTVALSGDGGDELFAGYNRHVMTDRLWRMIGPIPPTVRRTMISGAASIPPRFWAAASGRGDAFGQKIAKGLQVAAQSRDIGALYSSFLDEWWGRQGPVLGGQHCGVDLAPIAANVSAAAKLGFWDARTYLPDDILVKVDRAAMACSLETRVPFLDHRLAQVAARVPTSMKLRGGKGKLILRKVLERRVPASLFERPKAGFAIPLGDWLRGPLRDWAEDLLDEKSLRTEGYFDAQQVRARWSEHLAGKTGSAQALWAILMFQAWLRDGGA